MDTKKIREMASNPNFIPGIYNYCDRWCERCSFTDKCMNYAMEKERFPKSHDNPDVDNEVFWEELAETLHDTLEMLREMMKERGIDIDEIEVTEEDEKKEEDLREFTKNHFLTKMADEYIKMGDEWLKRMEPAFEENGVYYDRSDMEGDKEKMVALRDALEVIRWYLFQISVKIQRALQGMQRHEGPDDEAFLYDSNGSAKVALLGIDRSLSAWQRMTGFFPKEEDNIIDMMILLGRLREKTEKVFPGARKFKRPGFDEG